MLKRPKHLPVYVASYLVNGEIDITNKLCSTIISKISKCSNLHSWYGIEVRIESIDICRDKLKEDECPANTYANHDAKLVSKDEWIKAINKANKLIDEENKKEGTSRSKLSY